MRTSRSTRPHASWHLAHYLPPCHATQSSRPLRRHWRLCDWLLGSRYLHFRSPRDAPRGRQGVQNQHAGDPRPQRCSEQREIHQMHKNRTSDPQCIMAMPTMVCARRSAGNRRRQGGRFDRSLGEVVCLDSVVVCCGRMHTHARERGTFGLH